MTSDPYMDVLNELRELTLKKRAGYSPGADPFANFRMSKMFGVNPVVGIMIRTMDKLARAASLLANPDNDRVGESLRDTLLDAGNYPLIAVAYLDSERTNLQYGSVEIARLEDDGSVVTEPVFDTDLYPKYCEDCDDQNDPDGEKLCGCAPHCTLCPVTCACATDDGPEMC